MKRIFDVQKNWNQREKLRQTTINRPLPNIRMPPATYIPTGKVIANPFKSNYSFKETNEEEINKKFMAKVMEKVDVRRKALEEDVNKTIEEINKLKITKKEEKENAIIAILYSVNRKDEGLIRVRMDNIRN
jgi:hypothetical protein